MTYINFDYCLALDPTSRRRQNLVEMFRTLDKLGKAPAQPLVLMYTKDDQKICVPKEPVTLKVNGAEVIVCQVCVEGSCVEGRGVQE